MVGCGYVGLVSGTCFADTGQDVVCIDHDQSKINLLKRGVVSLYEPGLAELVKKNITNGRLRFSCDLKEHVKVADIIFITVGTPARREPGDVNLSYCYKVAEEIASYLNDYTVVVCKSTVPVGSSRKLHDIISNLNADAQFDIVSNPEFLRQGQALLDFNYPDRIIIGVESERAERVLGDLYGPIKSRGVPVLVTDLESAELTKYVANAFLATKLSFINEMAVLCEASGADIHAVATGIGLDKRISDGFLRPGPGYGGSCLPKDIEALLKMAQSQGVSSRIVESVIESNVAQKARAIDKVEAAFNGALDDKRIAVLGLTFKPDTDDMRDAPSLSILPVLLKKGAQLVAYDPKGMSEAKKLLPDGIIYKDDPYATAEQADAILLLTEWEVFETMQLECLKDSMRDNKFIDLRNIYEPDDMQNKGFDYHCIGR